MARTLSLDKALNESLLMVYWFYLKGENIRLMKIS
jgi:hypothetical protein